MNTIFEPNWERAARTKMGIYLTTIETTFILKSIDFDHYKVVVDLDSGGGKFSILAFQKNAYVISLDRDLNSLKWLKARDHSSNVVLGDVRALPLRENIVDSMFLIEVFDYISETKTILAVSYRILKKKGLFIFSFGNTSSLKSKLKQLRKNIICNIYIHIERLSNHLTTSISKSFIKRDIFGCFSIENRIIRLFPFSAKSSNY